DDEAIEGGVIAAEPDIETGMMPAQPVRERFGHPFAKIAKRDRARTLRGDRRGNRRADPTRPDDQAIRAGKLEALRFGGAGKADAVEHLAIERTVRAFEDR